MSSNRLRALVVGLALGVFAACAQPQPKPIVEPTRPTNETPDATDPVESTPGTAGAQCDAMLGCTNGLRCITYYGVAGAKGPSFHTCEKSCAEDPRICTTGTRCITIADGPGRVCR